MDQPQVDTVESQRGKARVERFPLSPRVALRQLCGHEELCSGHAALLDRLPDLGLVAIHGCRVDVPVAHLERVANCLERGSTTQLPRAEPQQRHPLVQAELHRLVCDQLVVVHIRILPAAWCCSCRGATWFLPQELRCDRRYRGWSLAFTSVSCWLIMVAPRRR